MLCIQGDSDLATFGIMFTITITSTYLVDSNPTRAASGILPNR